MCVILIDATVGFTEQDSKVAGYAHEQGKGCIIAVNKWDAVEKDGKTMQEFRKKLEIDFSFMPYAPFLFISAKTGQRVDKLYQLIQFVNDQNAMRITTGMLNDCLLYTSGVYRIDVQDFWELCFFPGNCQPEKSRALAGRKAWRRFAFILDCVIQCSRGA